MNSSDAIRNYKHDITGKFNIISKFVNEFDESIFEDESNLEVFLAIHEVLVKMVKTSEKVIETQFKNKEEIVKNEKVVLIDDDKLIHLTWIMEAKKRNIEMVTFFSVAEFLNNSENIPLTSKIYVDSNLGAGLRGEVESEKIFNLGFKEIYLATGFDSDDIDRPYWIKKVIGKAPTF